MPSSFILYKKKVFLQKFRRYVLHPQKIFSVVHGIPFFLPARYSNLLFFLLVKFKSKIVEIINDVIDVLAVKSRIKKKYVCWSVF